MKKKTWHGFRKQLPEMPVPLLDMSMDQLLKEHVGSPLNLCMCHLVKRTPMKPFVMYKSRARKLHHIYVLVVQLLQLYQQWRLQKPFFTFRSA
ncbi:uncharacterized protein LOC119168188 isoform X2 [Rhipicephalus microplus]|uniref:uncharacterized protein LOC119168188 isoform X2 n=1 Tax=Rhipicephalus microplus TaxID=6941 RepID=UPI003F6BC8C5